LTMLPSLEGVVAKRAVGRSPAHVDQGQAAANGRLRRDRGCRRR
jgi:hypothetical protein